MMLNFRVAFADSQPYHRLHREPLPWASSSAWLREFLQQTLLSVYLLGHLRVCSRLRVLCVLLPSA